MEEISGNTASRGPKRTKGPVIILVGAILFLAIFGYGLWPQFSASDTVSGTLVLGSPAPTFTLSLIGGGDLSLASLRGSAVVVNLWASWCGPCRMEAPTLEAVWQEYKDKGVAFVGVDVNDVPDDAKAFLKEFNITYPNGPDMTGTIARAYRITGVPETFLVSKDGRFVKRFIGPVQKDTLESALNDLLRQ